MRLALLLVRCCMIQVLLAPALVAQAQPAGPAHGAAGDTVRFRVYTGTGTEATLEDVVAAMDRAEVVFMGEEHDDAATHRLQYALLQHAYGRYGTGPAARPVALSLEMFERDVQGVLDEYLAGLITETHFLESSRPWDNYAADYRPLVTFAQAHGLPVIAANAPRRYVNRVSRLGAGALRDLPPEALSYLAPLPYPPPSAAFREKWDALMAEMGATQHGTAPDSTAPEADAAGHGHGGDSGADRMLEAQALWDATMAHTLATFLMQRPEALVLHLAGGFHVEGGHGTPAYLRRYRPGTRLLVVAVRPAEPITAFDPARHAGLGDFVVLTERLP